MTAETNTTAEFLQWVYQNKEVIMLTAMAFSGVTLLLKHKNKKQEAPRKDKDKRIKIRGSKWKRSTPPQQRR